jgi:hypothetical protein
MHIFKVLGHRNPSLSNDVAIAFAVDVAFMAVDEFVCVLVGVAVMMLWCKVGVNVNSCFSRCCSAADLLHTI